MFTLNKENIKSALVYGVLVGLLAVFGYIYKLGDVFKIDWKVLVNVGSSAFIGFTISLIKNFLTTNSGKFLGVINVIPNKE